MGHHVGGIGVSQAASKSSRDHPLDVVESDAREDICAVVCGGRFIVLGVVVVVADVGGGSCWIES